MDTMASATRTSISVKPRGNFPSAREGWTRSGQGGPLAIGPALPRHRPHRSHGRACNAIALPAEGQLDDERTRRRVGTEFEAHYALRAPALHAQSGNRHALREGARAQEVAVANLGPARFFAEAPEPVGA